MKRIVFLACGFLLAFAVMSGAFELGRADADNDHTSLAGVPPVELAQHPYRDTFVALADTGSAAASEATAAPPLATVPPIASPLDELAALKAKYDALKAAKSGGGSKDLIWFAYALLGAAVLRVLLAAINAYRGDKPKKWAKWTALALAVPIALLTYYGMGTGWWQAIVMAGAGPGAIVANEAIKSFQKKPA